MAGSEVGRCPSKLRLKVDCRTNAEELTAGFPCESLVSTLVFNSPCSTQDSKNRELFLGNSRDVNALKQVVCACTSTHLNFVSFDETLTTR
jgi:hypothetical protein